jgi:hypothetical protein
MSRPQKIIPPIKGGFAQIINSIADGKGVKRQPSNQSPQKMVRSAPSPKKP